MNVNLEATELAELLREVDVLRAELDELRPLKPEDENRVLAKLRLEWTYHSNAIEGNRLTLGETRMLIMEGLTVNGKPLKDHLDIEGHNDVLDFLVSFIQEKKVLTEATIREMHKILLVRPYCVRADTPEGGNVNKWVTLGAYKKEPNCIITATGSTHRFISPLDTPAKMAELVEWVRMQDPSVSHPVITAAVFHHRFVSIHPFDDGNGRMARILMNLLLMLRGFPPVVIRIDERSQYFLALGFADSGDTKPLCQFIAEHLRDSLALYLRAARGESVEGSDDIDKEIALLNQELRHVQRPKLFSVEIYGQFLGGPLPRLLQLVCAKLSKFDELYATSSVMVSSNYGAANLMKSVPEIMNQLKAWGMANPPRELRFMFGWQTFLKAGLRNFDDSIFLVITFHQLKFDVEFGRKPRREEFLYSPEITDEFFNEVARDMAKDCLEYIRARLRTPP